MPVGYGVTPGSGPGHLALFGYDPLKYEVGRGVLEALGIDFDLQPQRRRGARQLLHRSTPRATSSDRRAGRVATEMTAKLCERMRQVKLPGVEVLVEPVREHRFVLVLRGDGLDDGLEQTDPEREGVPPLPVQATAPKPSAPPTWPTSSSGRRTRADQGRAAG